MNTQKTTDIGRRRRMMVGTAHVLVILILFFLPELMMSYSRPQRAGSFQWLMYIKSALYVVSFYIEYCLIINRTLFVSRRRVWAYVGYNLLLVVVMMCVMSLAQHALWQDDHGMHRHPLPHKAEMIRELSLTLRDLGMLVLTLALATAMRFGQQWKSMEERHEQMMVSQQAAELLNLKSQINPHFLFNTLNTIYSLIEVSPAEAQQAVHTLSKLLRYVLYENPSMVTVEQECDFVNSYVSLMQTRLGADCIIADCSGVTDKDEKVAPLLFISLIENAFKHGVTGDASRPVEIKLSAADGVVTCRTHNYIKKVVNKESGGIGLINLRRRLQLLYGDDATLETVSDGDQYTATLTLKSKR